MNQKNNLFKDKKELAKYIHNAIYKIMKEYGYKKGEGSFYIKKTELSCLINIQKGRYSNLDEEYFTLNWGLYFPLDAYFYNYVSPKKPSFSRCLVGNRISWLKMQNDNWWTLYTSSQQEETNKVLKEVEYYIKEYGIPFLAKLNSIEDVIEMLETTKTKSNFHEFYARHLNPDPFQAILYLYINKKDKSLEIMDKVIVETESYLYRENMQDLKIKIQNFNSTKYYI